MKVPIVTAYCLLFALLLPYSTFINAQTTERCGTMAVQQVLLQKDPTLANRLAYVQQQVQQYIAGHPNAHQRSIITIPVVVHVVHNGEPLGTGSNITDAQVLSEIEVLNADYRRLNSDTFKTPAPFKALAVDMQVEFCMAVRSPDGRPTNGIERINGGKASWVTSDIDATLKPATVWSPSQYLNIWTLKLGGGSADILGYAIMPGNDSTMDGVVIGYNYFGNTGNVTSPYNLGRTSTHEVGHWLGLYHPWSKTSPPSTPSCNDDDGIADTPHEEYGNFGCPTFPHITCNNGPNGDMFMNYMDYVDDNCMNLFTIGQKTSVYGTFSTSRSSILTSLACTRYAYDAATLSIVLPSTQVCDGNFSPLIQISNEGATNLTSCLINYIIDSNGFNQYNWSGNLVPGQSAYVNLPSQNLTAGSHNIQVYTSGPNNHIDQNPGNDGLAVTFNVLSNTAGNTLPLVEGFEANTNLPFGWTLDSSGVTGIKWQVTANAGSSSNNSVWINNFKGTVSSNSRGKKSGLIAPPVFIPVGKSIYAKFDVAYAQKDSTSKDSLTVAYSIDCGATWTILFADGGASLATAPISPTTYVPSTGEWKKAYVEIPNITNEDHALIRFQSRSDWGNNIYLDNIDIEQVAYLSGINNLVLPTWSMNIAPNPTDGKLNISFNQPMPENTLVELFDVLGRQILHTYVVGKETIIDLTGKQSGFYLVKVTSNGVSQTKRLVKL